MAEPLLETIAKALHANECVYTDCPHEGPDKFEWRNASAVKAALFDLHGQTQWGALRADGHHIAQRGSGPDAERFMRDYVAKHDGTVISRRVLPSIETEWEPAT